MGWGKRASSPHAASLQRGDLGKVTHPKGRLNVLITQDALHDFTLPQLHLLNLASFPSTASIWYRWEAVLFLRASKSTPDSVMRGNSTSRNCSQRYIHIPQRGKWRQSEVSDLLKVTQILNGEAQIWVLSNSEKQSFSFCQP